jgi:hypothetical protein
MNQWVDSHEIWRADHDIEDHLDSKPLNPVASTIPKWRTFTLLRWVQGNPLITFEAISGFR